MGNLVDTLSIAVVVDLDALWKIVLAAFAAGVGGVGALLLVISGTTRIEHGRDPRTASLATAATGYAMAAVGIALLVAALVIGFLAMTHK